MTKTERGAPRVWASGIHTQGRGLEELFANVEEAAQLHFEEELIAGKTVDVLITAQKEINSVLSVDKASVEQCCTSQSEPTDAAARNRNDCSSITRD